MVHACESIVLLIFHLLPPVQYLRHVLSDLKPAFSSSESQKSHTQARCGFRSRNRTFRPIPPVAPNSVRFMPHAVSDLEPTFALLASQDPTDYNTWQTRYVLFLWLSIIALIPFDLATVDSTLAQNITTSDSKSNPQTDKEGQAGVSHAWNKPGTGLVGRMVGLAVQYLSDAGPAREAAAIFLSRLLSRYALPERDRTLVHSYTSCLSHASDRRIHGVHVFFVKK